MRRDLHVSWFQITMDNPFLVSGLKSVGYLPRNGQGFLDWHRTFADEIRDGWSLNQFHYQRAIFYSVDTCNVRVIERCEYLSFTSEPCNAIGIAGKLLGNNLYSYFTSELLICCTIDLTHATL